MFFVHFIFLSVCSVFILFYAVDVVFHFASHERFFDCKFRCVPIRLTNSDLTLVCNTIHLLFPIFCFCYIFICFYFWFIFLYIFSSLKPSIFVRCHCDVIIIAAAIVFLLLFHLKLLDSPLIYMLKGVLFESITFYLLFVCQI